MRYFWAWAWRASREAMTFEITSKPKIRAFWARLLPLLSEKIRILGVECARSAFPLSIRYDAKISRPTTFPPIIGDQQQCPSCFAWPDPKKFSPQLLATSKFRPNYLQPKNFGGAPREKKKASKKKFQPRKSSWDFDVNIDVEVFRQKPQRLTVKNWNHGKVHEVYRPAKWSDWSLLDTPGFTVTSAFPI